MATNFESIYEKFLLQIDDYELGLIQDFELANLCFGYLEKARALYFPQCAKDLDDILINHITYIDGVRVEPLEVTGVQSEVDSLQGDELITEGKESDTEPTENDEVFIKIEGYFNNDLSNNEQFILAMGMKKAWLSSKKFSADLMSKDIGDRDYKAVQGFNYIKEIKSLDIELEEEIRRYGVQYTYNIDDLSTGW